MAPIVLHNIVSVEYPSHFLGIVGILVLVCVLCFSTIYMFITEFNKIL